MAVKTFGTKRRIAAAAAGIATVMLTVASFSWACTSGNEEFFAEPPVARGGDPVTFTGNDWLPGRVQIFLTTSAPQPMLLATTPVQPDGTLKTTAALPTNLSPGMYPVTTVRVAPDGKTIPSLTGNFDLRVLPTPQALPQEPAPRDPGPQAQETQTEQPASQEPAPQQQRAAQQANVPAQVSVETPVAAAPAPATAEVPAAAPVEVAPTPEPTVGPPVATAPAPEDAWQPQETDPSLLDDRSSGGSNSGLLVGAGLLAVGSVALFAGFTVAVARRRRAPATSGF